MSLTQAEQKFLAGHRLAMLATVGPDGGPQNKPVGYAYNDELGTIDIYGLNMAQSAKYRNVARQPLVALVVDNPSGVGPEAQFLEIRGQAETTTAEAPPFPGASAEIIRIHPRRVVALSIDPDQPGLRTRDLGAAGR
ncbi:MAG TPA: PPOX class F420-dependent oxidoreductase [Streptosporangiaceae bacterium]|jgi:pyridoxamine 5'-phosphate oxidase family protein